MKKKFKLIPNSINGLKPKKYKYAYMVIQIPLQYLHLPSGLIKCLQVSPLLDILDSNIAQG